MEHSKVWPKAITGRRKSPLIWVDFLVVTAAVLAFAVIVIINDAPTRSSTGTSPRARDVTVQMGQLAEDPGLVRARLRLATGGPWS